MINMNACILVALHSAYSKLQGMYATMHARRDGMKGNMRTFGHHGPPTSTFINRFGDTYFWKDLGDDRYLFVMDGDWLKYARAGGRKNSKSIDMDDLGMFDPSGGPYVAIGSIVEAKKVIHIKHTEDGYVVTVE